LCSIEYSCTLISNYFSSIVALRVLRVRCLPTMQAHSSDVLARDKFSSVDWLGNSETFSNRVESHSDFGESARSPLQLSTLSFNKHVSDSLP
jgi:hypothetical protein